MMKPNLNKADIELLRGTFATKDDLKAMEERLEARFATKVEIDKRFDSLEKILTETFQEYEERIQRIESELGISLQN